MMMFNDLDLCSNVTGSEREYNDAANAENNFGLCEWCGGSSAHCKCFNNQPEQVPDGWLEQALGEILDNDPGFQDMTCADQTGERAFVITAYGRY